MFGQTPCVYCTTPCCILENMVCQRSHAACLHRSRAEGSTVCDISNAERERRAVASFASKRLHYQLLFLAFQCITLALVLFLMYVPELLTWWPSILGHYPNDFIGLVESVTNTRVFEKESKILDCVKGNDSVFCSLCQVSPPNWIIKLCTTTCVIITVRYCVKKNLARAGSAKLAFKFVRCSCAYVVCTFDVYNFKILYKCIHKMCYLNIIKIMQSLQDFVIR